MKISTIICIMVACVIVSIISGIAENVHHSRQIKELHEKIDRLAAINNYKWSPAGKHQGGWVAQFQYNTIFSSMPSPNTLIEYGGE